MNLYRPVGIHELRLIAESGWTGFPPRLPGQPIFYPVLDRSYAEQIARDWNPGDEASGFAGFVISFALEDSFAARYEIRTVGAGHHRELWVPAEELEAFNQNLVGPIRVLCAFYGDGFEGQVDSETNLPGGLSSGTA